ncbi:hypothetical protein D7V20_18995 [Acinetobacter rongchengensis]|uniref:Uncharacterized protein n=2 Tax=Acinetobacter rongchengensis TaxID=2419601 RepID=A0A3A8E8M8_9GAMM|nr:hypothetical protein D7V20_18995 [Acinetobacter rongchengensis]
MMHLEELELFPQEIYLIELFISYEYYYETVKLWEDLIQYAEGLLDKYNVNLVSDHRSQHLSHQADYVWGTIVLPNFKGTLHHLQSGLEDLKDGFLPILGRMSSICNDLVAQGRDYPCDWMDQVIKGASIIFKEKKDIISVRANNIYVASDYNMQWDYKDLLKNKSYKRDVGIIYPKVFPKYNLNQSITMQTGEPIMVTGIYHATEPYSACKFLMKEKNNYSGMVGEWVTAPKVKGFENNPNNFTTLDTIENSRRVPTTWILVERVAEGNDVDLTPTQEKLSQKGGEPCPKTGYWTTPARPGTRRYFTQGEVLPTLPNADWGIVYWYFSSEE